MKTQLVCVAVALLGLACSIGIGTPIRLPGNEVGNGDLNRIWAASSNPSPTGSGSCTWTAGSLWTCAIGASLGAQCNGETFNGPGDIDCTGGDSTTTRYNSGTDDCFPSGVTVKVCELTGTLTPMSCTGSATVFPPGVKHRYCRAAGSLPKEP